MKKTIALIFAVLLIFSLVGCSKYVSSYKAFMLVTEKDSQRVKMSFSSFEGTRVFDLRCPDGSGELVYSAEIEEGSATVFIDVNGTKTELFKLGAGDKISSSIKIDEKYVYVIIETTAKCENGKFEFNVK